ncbi:hypothetical protein LAU_0170 [Lausannevirus]|uniref:Uncharacterized protein n=1 Tax=Lausannevirus TaxID=999883 RepID=F2WL98_9VIRU|nr:hypothetical protein LAU_0170 [Lausannevirus]AEA07021.1 hypothetical protein LAU_0170 [Lausannevirus]
MPLLILEEELEYFLEKGTGHICFSDNFSLSANTSEGIVIGYKGSKTTIKSERNNFNVRVCKDFVFGVLEKVRQELEKKNL